MDGIELAIFGSLFSSVCEEMGACLGRSAFSPNIKERLDYSCALFDLRGRLLAQACHIPVHLGAMAYALEGLIREHPLDDGDVLILNDPFRGGTHLPDVTLVAPVFFDGRKVAYVADRAHHSDMGGSAPGSMGTARLVSEEGILIEPALLVRKGRLERGFFNGLLSRMRSPEEREGDFRAQLAALEVGAAGIRRMAARYGPGKLEQAGAALVDAASTYLRSFLSNVPGGEYEFEDRLDGDGLGSGALPIHVRLEFSEERCVVDFSGTSGSCEGNLNAPYSVTASAVLYCFRCLLPPYCPSNAGLLEPIELRIPPGCLLDARYPRAVAAGNVETSQRVVDVVLGAMSLAIPERVPAASCGSMNNVAAGSDDFAYYETIAGGAGAGPGWRGRSAVHTHMTNTLNTPAEVLESHYPLRLVRYALRRGSGGTGRYPGGNGVVRELEMLEDCTVSLLGERRAIGPYGLSGAGGGLPGRDWKVDRTGTAVPLAPKGVYGFRAGERLVVETPGGGGYGHPREGAACAGSGSPGETPDRT